MAKQRQPMPAAEWKAHLHHEALRARAHKAAMAAGQAAIDRGAGPDEVGRAMNEARARIMPSARALVPATPQASTPIPIPAETWTRDKQRAFLVHLAETGCVRQACAHVGMSRQSAYKLRRRVSHSVFALGWDVAIDMSRQALLDEATERAFLGREEPVWYHGEQVGSRTVHNDRLLMFLLGHKREPLNAMLDPAQMMALFPSMLDMVDQILPSPLTPEFLAELKAEYGGPGDGDEPEDDEIDDEDWDEDWDEEWDEEWEDDQEKGDEPTEAPEADDPE